MAPHSAAYPELTNWSSTMLTKITVFLTPKLTQACLCDREFNYVAMFWWLALVCHKLGANLHSTHYHNRRQNRRLALLLPVCKDFVMHKCKIGYAQRWQNLMPDVQLCPVFKDLMFWKEGTHHQSSPCKTLLSKILTWLLVENRWLHYSPAWGIRE